MHLPSFIIVVITGHSLASDCETICECKPKDFNKDGRYDVNIATCRGHNVVDLPTRLPYMTTELYLSGTSIKHVKKNAFIQYSNLSTLYFRDFLQHSCMLESLEAGAFNGLPRLKVLGIVGCERLMKIESGVLGSFQELHTLQIFRSGLKSVPDFSEFQTLRKSKMGYMDEINLSSNRIEEIPSTIFSGVKTHVLKLDSNRLRRVKNNAFNGARVVILNMVNNPNLEVLEDDAFKGIKDLDKINLSRTAIHNLPVTGLEKITELYIKETKTLVNFPSILQFSNIKIVQLYYPYHCCAFKNPQKQYPAKWREYEEFQRQVERKCSKTTSPFISTTQMPTEGSSQNTMALIPEKTQDEQRSKRFVDMEWSSFHSSGDESDFEEINNHSSQNSAIGTFGNFIYPDDTGFGGSLWGTPYLPDIKHETPKPHEGIIFLDKSTVSINSTQRLLVTCGEVFIDYTKVSCIPEPDAFNPCEDVMGYKWLRIFVWLVVMAALFGNVVVLIVIITSRSKMTVAKFLMCNLAFADFLMGIYLLLLASIDAHTLGEYFNYAILWQNEGGCQAAGFITVFSSELSIFTLTVITLERWYAISHAIHLTKRLKLRQAVVIMTFGWSYAALMAILPLVGISTYGNVSVCLPMKAETAGDLSYIVSLLVINGCAFLVICMCYLNMYYRVRGSESTANSSDATIAKRMAMLVFTNFICYTPIAFFGLTASAGLPLIDITNSKILLVFFYPLNSCANPYLYVIITKQFRKDMYILLGKYGFCTNRANRYKLSMTHSKTVTHSRKDSLALNNVIHPVDGSLTHITGSLKSSKDSGNATPSMTPQLTPYMNGHSPNISFRFRHDSISSKHDRKLSIVPEINTVYKNAYGNEKTTSPTRFNIRSSSEYVLFFPPNRTEVDSSHRTTPKYEHQISHVTYISSNSGTTDHSSFSDTSFEDPWILQETKPQVEAIPEFEVIKEDKTDITYNVNHHGDQSNDEESDADDKVQQTLLKHCTLRNSPASMKRDEVTCYEQYKNDKVQSKILSRSPSTSSLEEFDETQSLSSK